MHKTTMKSYHKLTYLLALSLGLSISSSASAYNYESIHNVALLDSVGNEIVNGERFVLHKIERQETYYKLSREYNVPVKTIQTANKNKSLKPGDVIRIPRGKASVNTATKVAPTTITSSVIPTQDFTEYIVGKGETLYAISRRFEIDVDDIKKFNNLTSNVVREGQILKVPNMGLVTPEPVAVDSTPVVTAIEERQPIDDSMFKSNKYGIREKKERGIGVWIASLSSNEETSLALHKTAPIGTILKITNPMNRNVTFAKVVGKFNENHETQNAIVVISKSVATSIGALDKKFQVEITYGLPLDN